MAEQMIVDDYNYEILMSEAAVILNVLPERTFDEVYLRLKNYIHIPNRADLVIEELLGSHIVPGHFGSEVGSKRNIENLVTGSENPKKRKIDSNAAANVLYDRDMSQASTSREDDITLVKELRNGVDFIDLTLPEDTTDAEETSRTSNPETQMNGEDENDTFQNRLQSLKETFPEADPDFLMNLVLKPSIENFDEVVLQMLETRDYPKLKDRQVREKLERIKISCTTKKYTPEDILQWFEDPVSYFSNIDRVISDSYRQHSTIQCYNDWPKLTLISINGCLRRNMYHYYSTYKSLQELNDTEKETVRYKRRQRRRPADLPAIPDEMFYKELAFTKIEKEFDDYVKNKKLERESKIAQARLDGSFLVCQCCFDGELLIDDAIECGVGHFFCKECVCKGAEVAAGQSLCELNCMADSCDRKFSLHDLQSVLKPSIFSNWLIRIQKEEVLKANIPDLFQCPHCDFAAIMSNPDDKVFRCLNSDCLKETCRLCKEPNHVPLRCNEIESNNEVKMRTYIEDKMTEALIRTCPSCKRRFMKEIGCNMMSCVCGQNMCYVCRQPVEDYSHFGLKGCPQFTNTKALHRREVAEGGLKAKQTFVEEHPELNNVVLKHDPTKSIKSTAGNQATGEENAENSVNNEENSFENEDFEDEDS